MTPTEFRLRVGAVCSEDLSPPGGGATATRHRRLMEAGREDLSVAKLAEAHWDAVAILKEAGRAPQASAIYGVWASDIPGMHLHLDTAADGYELHGGKMFCSGAGLIDRALITVNAPERLLVDLDLRANQHTLQIDNSTWITDAFSLYKHERD